MAKKKLTKEEQAVKDALKEKLTIYKKISMSFAKDLSIFDLEEKIIILNFLNIGIRHQMVEAAQENVEKLLKSGKQEEWKTVDTDDRYEISNFGRLRKAGDTTNKSATVGAAYETGYLKTTKPIKTGKKNKDSEDIESSPSMHRLVALAFIDNPKNLPYVNHTTEKKYINDKDSLAWSSEQENASYGTSGLRSRIIREINEEFGY